MKSKKTKLIVFLTVLLCLVAPLFSGCTTTIKLNKPTFVNYQVSSITGEQMLITDNNTFASGWLFGIATEYDNNDTSNFFTYKTDKPYFYVTDIFVNAQTYYFYSQVIGKNEYVSSEISEVKSVTINYKLDAPVLELTGTTLNWTNVQNADKYIIYANDIVVTEVSQNSYDISNYVANQNSNQPFVFTVACKQNDNYLKSAKSNQKVYSDHLILKQPTNLVITGNASKVLRWSAVEHCNQYLVVINNTYELTAYSNSLNLTEYLNQNGIGTYYIKIKSIGEGWYRDSDFCQNYQYDNKIQLATPSDLESANGVDYVRLGWTAVENASEYALYLNGERYYPNQNTGINSPIVSNNILLKFEDLLNFDLSNLKFQVQALAINGSYFENSNLSKAKLIVTELSTLKTPTITLDSENKCIYITNVQNAQLYKVEYTFDGVAQTPIYINAGIGDKICFDYKTQFVEVGSYTLKVMAIAEYELLNSTYSNEVSFEIEPPITTLKAPNVKDIYVNGDNVYVEFDKIDTNSQTFSLYANNTLINTNITPTINFVSLDELFGIIGNTDVVSICLSANSTDAYHLASEKSASVNLSTRLSKPTNVALNGASLSWSAVKNAQTYCLIIDNDIVDLHTANTNINISNYVSQNKTRQIKLFAKTDYFTPSIITEGFVYNNVAQAISGYTDKYFYYGETYDYYITSQKELNDLFSYAVDNFIEDVKFYLAYDNTTTNGDKMQSALDNLTGSFGFSYSRKNTYAYSGEASIHFNFYDISQYVDHTPEYPQFNKTYQYKSQTGRASNYNGFASDKWYVTQDVYTSDGLVSAVANKAVPNFVNGSDTAEQIYNIAKQILLQICDDTMTDYQKALAIHDYIVLNIDYDHYGLENSDSDKIGYYHYLESVFFNGFGVCDGYAKAYSLMCNMEGIPTVFVGGASEKTDIANTGHAWNKSYLDADGDGTKEWLSVDCTWDDAATSIDGSSYDVLSHKYFMIPDSYIGERYEDIEYPQSVKTGLTYFDIFTINGLSLKVDTEQQLQTLVDALKASTHSGYEILLSSSILNSFAGITISRYTYSFVGGYYRVYIYKN